MQNPQRLLDMAKFEGRLDDFHILVGPKIRNDVATLTKKKKNELHSICQKCNEKRELDAAHIHGRSRKDIIEMLLDKFKSDDGQYVVPNLRAVIEEIKAEHIPIEKNFYFLCKKCHLEYDSKPSNSAKKSKISHKLNSNKNEMGEKHDEPFPKEILCKTETNSWKYKMGWTSIQNRKNIEKLISKIESTLNCRPLAFKSWYFHKRSDNNKQFSGIMCHKNHSLICFRIEPDSFGIDDKRIMRGKRWFFAEGKEGRIEIIPENYDLIMNCLSYAYDISS